MNKKLGWLNKEVFILLTGLFVIAQTLGIIVAKNLITLGIKSTPMTGDLNNPLEAVYLIFMILFMTVFILILLKYRKNNSLWIFEAIAIFSTSIIIFGSFFPQNDTLVLLITLTILAYRYTHKKSLMYKNFVSILAISGAGAILGISLGVIPSPPIKVLQIDCKCNVSNLWSASKSL
jgi:presenilin-like A22 family membrane protease